MAQWLVHWIYSKFDLQWKLIALSKTYINKPKISGVTFYVAKGHNYQKELHIHFVEDQSTNYGKDKNSTDALYRTLSSIIFYFSNYSC